MVIGYLCEGWDHRIVHVLLCRLLAKAEPSLQALPFPVRYGLGWKQVVARVEPALKHFFYQHRAIACVVGVDNDGRQDLDKTGEAQSNASPRHWVHKEQDQQVHPQCRFCQLTRKAERVSSHLTPGTFVPAHQWPVVICVPVEAIEAWLLTARKLIRADGLLEAERRPGDRQLKIQFYGSAVITGSMVEQEALPLLRSLAEIRDIARYSNSFHLFAQQVDNLRPKMQACAKCLGEVF